MPFFGGRVGMMGGWLKCGKVGHRVYTQALFYTCYLCTFALTSLASLPHFLICAHFLFNTLGLVCLLLLSFFCFASKCRTQLRIKKKLT
jgi:hypothetical protein